MREKRSLHPKARDLETPRLYLRRFRSEDADDLAEIYGDPDVMQFISDGVQTGGQVIQTLGEYRTQWEEQPWGLWAVVHKADARLIGMGGFVAPAEVAYILAKAYWGRGLATEIMEACLWYGFTYLKLERIGAGALLSNEASLRVIEKAGLRRTENEHFGANGGAYYAMTREAFQTAQTEFRLCAIC